MPDLSIDDRPAFVFQPRDGELTWDLSDGTLGKLAEYDRAWELVLVNRIRQRVAEWRRAGYPNASATTLDLLSHWRRDGRQQSLFFAQVEAVETVIFLVEARPDLRQGLTGYESRWTCRSGGGVSEWAAGEVDPTVT